MINLSNIYCTRCKKFFSIMKYTFIFIFLGILSVSAESYAQFTKLSLDMQDVTLYEVVSEIEKQSEFMFFYKSGDIDNNLKVNIQAEDKTIVEILNEVTKNTDLTYVINNKHVLIANKSNEAFQQNVSQQISITGIVTDNKGESLPGVNVIVKGTTSGNISDHEGKYRIEVPDQNAVLVFSFVGFITEEIIVGNQRNINVSLLEKTLEIDEVVVIGYGTVAKKDLTGSVSQLKAEQYNKQQSTNMIDYLNGTIAGFNANMGTSASGAGAGNMEIRGPASISASNTPLIVLDGVIFNGGINQINPLDIETIDVLKDASSAAVFGARSAAGVVIITTKRGKGEKTNIGFSMQLGISDFTKEFNPYDLEGYMQYKVDYNIRQNPSRPVGYYHNPYSLPSGLNIDTWQNFDPSFASDPLETWTNRLSLQPIEKLNYRDGKTFDWYDAGTRTGFRQNYDVNLSGGTGKMKYYWSLGYTDNKGRMIGDEFKIIRSRINADVNVAEFLNVGVNAQFSNTDQSNVNITLGNLASQSPLGQPYNDDGTLRWYPFDDPGNTNPFLQHDYRDKFNIIQSLFATIYADVKLPLGFSYKLSFANRYDWEKDYWFDPSTIPAGNSVGGNAYRRNRSLYEWQIDNILSWKKQFGVHDFYVTLLYNAEMRQQWIDIGQSQGFDPNELLSYHQLKAGTSPTIENDDQYSTGMAAMGRINYTLLGRYLLTLTWRQDGYSAFGASNPYATFPSAAIAWNITNEPFFNVPHLNNLKARVSYGVNGNRDIGIYSALADLGVTKYLSGDRYVSGVYNNSMANSMLKWERTTAFNVGLDFALFDNRLSGVLDYYDMKTTDLLLTRKLPKIIGYNDVMSNMGELANKGFEATFNSRNFVSEQLQWNSVFTFSLNRNKIVHLYGEMTDVLNADGNVIGQREADDIENNRFIGQSLDRIWDYKFLGIWQLGEEDAARPFGKGPGDFKLYDKDENGVSTDEDKVFLGYTKPRYHLSLRNDITFLKNFNFSCFFRADLGHDRGNGLFARSGNQGNRNNDWNLPYWTPDTPSNRYSRLNSVLTPAYTVRESTGFLRLQDVTLAYSLPKNLTQWIKVENCSVYFSSRNLLTFTKWSGWDPESGNTPMPRIFTFGLNVSL